LLRCLDNIQHRLLRGAGLDLRAGLSRVARLGCVASAAVMLAGASFFEVFFEVFFLAGDFLAGAFFSFLSLPIVVECVCSIRPNSPRS
ncbi:hypothetical protein C8R47DRAFT_1147748, partial [Mycena vitilis]